MQFADKCLSCKLKGGKQPPCRQLFQASYREAQASCQMAKTSIRLFQRSKQQLLGKKSRRDHPRWRFLARQESGITVCRKGNLQTKRSDELRYFAFWGMRSFQLNLSLKCFRFKSLECRGFLRFPHPPVVFSYFAVSRGTLLKSTPTPPALGEKSITPDIASFWHLGPNGCTEYMPVCKIWHRVWATKAGKWGLSSCLGVGRNHRTEWLFLFVNACLLGWKRTSSPPQSLV